MKKDCKHVCAAVCSSLNKLDFAVNPVDNHDDVLDTLAKCRLVREDTGSFIIINWNKKGDCLVVTIPDSGEALILNTREEAEARAKNLCAWEWKVVAI